MGIAPPRLVELIENPFDGEGVVAAARQPEALAGLRMAFEPLVGDGFVTEMVADSSFRQERTGVEGFLEAWRDWALPFDHLRIEVQEIREVGDNLFTPVELVGVPKRGSSEIRQKAAAVWTLADRRLTRVEFHLDRETARRSAGIER